MGDPAASCARCKTCGNTIHGAWSKPPHADAPGPAMPAGQERVGEQLRPCVNCGAQFGRYGSCPTCGVLRLWNPHRPAPAHREQIDLMPPALANAALAQVACEYASALEALQRYSGGVQAEHQALWRAARRAHADLLRAVLQPHAVALQGEDEP